MKNFLVLAMRRSGHHAIVNWICKNNINKITHFNKCFMGWEQGKLLPCSHKEVITYENQSDVNHDYIYSLEDFDMGDFHKYKFTKWFEIFRRPTTVIIILRDVYNWAASSLKYGLSHVDEALDNEHVDLRGQFKPSRIKLYKKMAREVLDGMPNMPANTMFVSYNDWFSDCDYRCAISTQLGLRTVDRGFADVVVYGQGSSFDGRKYDGTANKMRVMERWKEYLGDERFLQVLRDQEFYGMSEQLFGHLPFFEEIRKEYEKNTL